MGHNYVLDGHGRIAALSEMRRQGYDLPIFPVVYIDANLLQLANLFAGAALPVNRRAVKRPKGQSPSRCPPKITGRFQPDWFWNRRLLFMHGFGKENLPRTTSPTSRMKNRTFDKKAAFCVVADWLVKFLGSV
jgi:hypothetical protein